MTRPDILQCVHEPFGDAYYYGPERLAGRYEDDEQSRLESGFGESTFQTIFDRINRENIEVRLSPSYAMTLPTSCCPALLCNLFTASLLTYLDDEGTFSSLVSINYERAASYRICLCSDKSSSDFAKCYYRRTSR